MAQLLVRSLDDGVVTRLKRRAVRAGVSAEAEHRRILQRALMDDAPPVDFKSALLSMPAVGEDADFARDVDYGRDVVL